MQKVFGDWHIGRLQADRWDCNLNATRLKLNSSSSHPPVCRRALEAISRRTDAQYECLKYGVSAPHPKFAEQKFGNCCDCEHHSMIVPPVETQPISIFCRSQKGMGDFHKSSKVRELLRSSNDLSINFRIMPSPCCASRYVPGKPPIPRLWCDQSAWASFNEPLGLISSTASPVTTNVGNRTCLACVGPTHRSG